MTIMLKIKDNVDLFYDLIKAGLVEKVSDK